MTQGKKWKKKVRERMARTGESYSTALHHLRTLGEAPPVKKKLDYKMPEPFVDDFSFLYEEKKKTPKRASREERQKRRREEREEKRTRDEGVEGCNPSPPEAHEE